MTKQDKHRYILPMAEPLALYVHWPFCVSKCPYCDFNSHVRESVDQAVWREALLADLQHEAALLPGRPVSSIFFGGGTPSLMPPGTVVAVIAAMFAAGRPVDDAVRLANRAGGIVVGKLGTAAVSPDELFAA